MQPCRLPCMRAHCDGLQPGAPPCLIAHACSWPRAPRPWSPGHDTTVITNRALPTPLHAGPLPHPAQPAVASLHLHILYDVPGRVHDIRVPVLGPDQQVRRQHAGEVRARPLDEQQDRLDSGLRHHPAQPGVCHHEPHRHAAGKCAHVPNALSAWEGGRGGGDPFPTPTNFRANGMAGCSAALQGAQARKVASKSRQTAQLPLPIWHAPLPPHPPGPRSSAPPSSTSSCWASCLPASPRPSSVHPPSGEAGCRLPAVCFDGTRWAGELAVPPGHELATTAWAAAGRRPRTSILSS